MSGNHSQLQGTPGQSNQQWAHLPPPLQRHQLCYALLQDNHIISPWRTRATLMPLQMMHLPPWYSQKEDSVVSS